MKKEIFDPSYSFDDLEILGVFGENVYLRGDYNEGKACIIRISCSLFKESLDCWLNDKKRHCEKWNEFCGTMGSVRPIEFSEVTESRLSSFKVKVFQFNSIDPDTDMEHG